MKKKVVFDNPLGWRSRWRDEVLGKGMKKAVELCKRRGYDGKLQIDETHLEMCRMGAGVCMGYVALGFSAKGRCNSFELYEF